MKTLLRHDGQIQDMNEGNYKYNDKRHVAALQIIVLNLQSFRILDKTNCFLYNHFVHTHV